MQPRFRLRLLFDVVTGFAIYVGSYRAMLDPMILVEVGHLWMVNEGSWEPHYRALNGACRFVLA